MNQKISLPELKILSLSLSFMTNATFKLLVKLKPLLTH